MSSIIKKFKPLVENKLTEVLKAVPTKYQAVQDAMLYSASIGGKRIRPCVLLEFAEICKGDMADALNIAAALECIHTYSLIHDDLPSMDNDDIRRGMPSCHKKFGEDIALLAGDGLLTLAFNLISECKNSKPQNVLKCIKILSEYAGVNGMIGGQVIDLKSEGEPITTETLIEMYTLKTSRLLQAAGVMGAVISDADETIQKAAYEYGLNLGIAFQIIDDILDVTSTTEQLGKPVGSDSENEKSTYVALNGLELARAKADEYTNKALMALEVFGDKADALKELTQLLLKRTK